MGYLSLDRPTALSGGEANVKVIRQLSFIVTDMTYVFDEPTVGLHPHDIADERPAAAAPQRQHGARRRAQPEVAIADHAVTWPRAAPKAARCVESTVESAPAAR